MTTTSYNRKHMQRVRSRVRLPKGRNSPRNLHNQTNDYLCTHGTTSNWNHLHHSWRCHQLVDAPTRTTKLYTTRRLGLATLALVRMLTHPPQLRINTTTAQHTAGAPPPPHPRPALPLVADIGRVCPQRRRLALFWASSRRFGLRYRFAKTTLLVRFPIVRALAPVASGCGGLWVLGCVGLGYALAMIP